MADAALTEQVAKLTTAVQTLVDRSSTSPKKTLEDRLGVWVPPAVLAALVVGMFMMTNNRLGDLEKKVDGNFQVLINKIEAVDGHLSQVDKHLAVDEAAQSAATAHGTR